MAAKNKSSQAVRLLHKEMVEKIGKLFPIPGDDWRTICNQVEMLELLSAKDMGKVNSMEDLFIKLVKSKDNSITYGKYEEIFDIFNERHVDAGRIITDFTKRMKERFKTNGKRKHSTDTDTQSEVKHLESKRRTGKLRDSETENEENQSTRRRRKRKHSTDTDTDTEVKHRESKRRKGKRRISSDSDSEVENEGRQSTRKKRNAGNLRKLHDDTHSANVVYTWQKAIDAVGFIQGPAFNGTGFRVGKDKIMTACHVMNDIARPRKHARPDLSNLKNNNVFITFNFLGKNGPKKPRKFYFKKYCVYDPNMDFAILQLRNEDKAEEPSYPKEIQRFKSASIEDKFALLGHPSEKPMQLDPNVQIVDQKSDQWSKRRKDMEDWWDRKHKQFEDEDTDDEQKVLFDCWVQRGASGSPGIEMDSDGKPSCSLMLIHGYPDSAFDEKYKIKEEDHPYMIEQGVTMKAIAEFLDTRDHKELRHEIFADSSFK